MNQSAPDNEISRESRLDELVARFLRAEEAGEPFDVEAEIVKHRDLGQEFRAFVDEHRRLRKTDMPTATIDNAPRGDASDDAIESWTNLTQPGKVVGDCRILRELGRGGMGVVYLAEHVRVKDLRALKVLPRDRVTDQAIRRFWREAQTAARINHLNVVSIHDVGQLRDLHYIVMQYVDGKTLVETVDRHLVRSPSTPLPWTYAFQLVVPVLDALAAMHRQGLVHRDIKPSNIMVTGAMSRRQHVLLMDFGLVQDESDATLTETGAVVGTPAFMSCEQARGKPLDGRADLYSLGATLYYLLAGRSPFQGSRTDVYLKVASGEMPEPIATLRPDIPTEVCAAVAKAMAPERSERYRRAEEMLREITSLLRGQGSRGGRREAPAEAAGPADIAAPGSAAPGNASPNSPERAIAPPSTPAAHPAVAPPPPVPTWPVPTRPVDTHHDTVSSAGETCAEPLPGIAQFEPVLIPSRASHATGSSSGRSSTQMLPRGDDEPELLAWLATITRRPWFAPAAGTAIVALLGLGAVLLLVFANSGQDEQKPPQRLAAKSQQDAGPAAEAKHPGMAYVPSGNVVLGADEGRLRSHARSLASISDNADAENLVEQFVDLCDDTPHRTVAVQGFWIDRNEVTNADYAKFITATGHPTPPHWIERRPPAGLENHPVTQVSYDDAQAYAKWAGKLLPTEAQWVRAYRGDSEYMYPWGNLWESGRAATFPDITDDTSRPVDAFPQDRTSQGVVDMVGNVCEMLRDRTRLDGVPVAVIKGADYGSNGDIYSAAPACRRVAVDDDQQPGIGFRCVIEESR